MNNNEFLQPCPFCGTANNLSVCPDYSEDDPEWIVAYYVRCGTCGARGRNTYPIGWCESEEEARQAWNHRGSVRWGEENQAEDALKKKPVRTGGAGRVGRVRAATLKPAAWARPLA